MGGARSGSMMTRRPRTRACTRRTFEVHSAVLGRPVPLLARRSSTLSVPSSLPHRHHLLDVGENAPDAALLLDHSLAGAADLGIEARDRVGNVVAAKPAIVRF